jgi:hypothetical protein
MSRLGGRNARSRSAAVRTAETAGRMAGLRVGMGEE